jgi:hypothetical protein
MGPEGIFGFISHLKEEQEQGGDDTIILCGPKFALLLSTKKAALKFKHCHPFSVYPSHLYPILSHSRRHSPPNHKLNHSNTQLEITMCSKRKDFYQEYRHEATCN